MIIERASASVVVEVPSTGFKEGDPVHIVGRFVAVVPGDPPEVRHSASIRIGNSQEFGGFRQIIVPLVDLRLPPKENPP